MASGWAAADSSSGELVVVAAAAAGSRRQATDRLRKLLRLRKLAAGGAGWGSVDWWKNLWRLRIGGLAAGGRGVGDGPADQWWSDPDPLQLY